MALAGAQGELEAGLLEGLQREIETSTRDIAGQARLDSLMAELGVSTDAAATEVEAIAAHAAPAVSTIPPSEADAPAGNPSEPVVLLDDGGIDVDKLNAELAARPVEAQADAGTSEK